MPAASASTLSSAACPSGRRNSSVTAPFGPKEKSLLLVVNARSEPSEQSFSRVPESYLCAETVFSLDISSQPYIENGQQPLDLLPRRNCDRILRGSVNLRNDSRKTC